jgi:dGTP triphosphohydrolase
MEARTEGDRMGDTGGLKSIRQNNINYNNNRASRDIIVIQEQIREIFKKEELLDEVEEMIVHHLEEAEDEIYASIEDLSKNLAIQIDEKLLSLSSAIKHQLNDSLKHIESNSKHMESSLKHSLHSIQKETHSLYKKLDSSVGDLTKSNKFTCNCCLMHRR